MISYQADLNRLLRWISDPRLPAKYALAGRLIGTADVARNGPNTTAQAERRRRRFRRVRVRRHDNSTTPRRQNATPTQPVWVEKKLTISLDGGYDQLADRLQLASLQIGSQALALQASGKVDSLATRQYVDLAGTHRLRLAIARPIAQTVSRQPGGYYRTAIAKVFRSRPDR